VTVEGEHFVVVVVSNNIISGVSRVESSDETVWRPAVGRENRREVVRMAKYKRGYKQMDERK